MKFLINFVVPIVLVIVLAITLLALGYKDAAWVVSDFGTILVLFGNFIYIIFFDSRKKWKNSDYQTRLRKVFSFQR